MALVGTDGAERQWQDLNHLAAGVPRAEGHDAGSWKLETPASVPCGARISAGKFGSVDRSLPNAAASAVNRSPVSCMPSPESPANLMTTRDCLRGDLSTDPDSREAITYLQR